MGGGIRTHSHWNHNADKNAPPGALRLIKQASEVRAIDLEFPRFAPEPLQEPLQCADGAMNGNRRPIVVLRILRVADLTG